MNELDIKYSENPKTLNAPLLTPNSKLIISNLNPSTNKPNHRYTWGGVGGQTPGGDRVVLEFFFVSFFCFKTKERKSINNSRNFKLTTHYLHTYLDSTEN
jgi:hypothetical protein